MTVKQGEPTSFQDLDQMPECYLGGIGDSMEHRLPEEGSSDGDPIEASRQLFLPPDLHVMSVTTLKKGVIALGDRFCDPSLFA